MMMSATHPARLTAAVLAALIGLLPVADALAQTRGPNFNSNSVYRPPTGGGDGVFPRRPRPGFGSGLGIIIDPGLFIPPPQGLPPPPPGGRRVIVEEEEVAPPRRVRQPRPERPRQPPPPRVAQPAPRSPVIIPAASEQRLVEREVLVHLRDGLTEQQTNALFRRQRLERLDSERIALIGVTLHRLRIPDNRTPRAVLGTLRSEARIAFAQPNYVYRLEQDQPVTAPAGEPATSPAPAAGPVSAPAAEAAPSTAGPGTASAAAPAPAALPAAPVAVQRLPQYAIDKLELADVHRLSRGARIKVAVIDSGIDTSHPELAGALDRSGDMLTGQPGRDVDADSHGTGMASAVFARSQLTGVAPAASLLAVRAFKGTTTGDRSGAQGTSWHVLKGIDWSVAEGARVLNLSFAGPRDELVSRALAAASGRGVIAVAAAGNAGPASAPLFPASDQNVIAVTALDAQDKVFAMANRGRHIAVAAPGVDVLVAQPSAGYGMTTGTSIATAHVSGLVALLIERDARLDLPKVRALLTGTARDLGAPGRDAETGAGLINIRAALARMTQVR
jgi:subtilisin family serine protease